MNMFMRYIKTLTKNFNILSNADADADANANANADADADAGVTAIALPVLSYRRAKNQLCRHSTCTRKSISIAVFKPTGTEERVFKSQ